MGPIGPKFVVLRIRYSPTAVAVPEVASPSRSEIALISRVREFGGALCAIRPAGCRVDRRA